MAKRKSPYHSDCFAREGDDELHFNDFCPTLSKIILEAGTPLTVGVFGPWGSGKTSLLKMLQDKVDEKQPSVRSVWFTAWKYEQYEALWRAFILRVLDSLYPRKEEKGKQREEWERYREDELTDQNQKELVKNLNHLEESVYRPVEWQELGRWTVNWWGLAKSSGKTIAKLAAAFVPGASFLDQALAIINSGIDDVPDEVAKAFQRQVKTYHLNQLQNMEQFEQTFAKVIELANIERLVVFVDDLDRCLPEKAIQILEAIKLFLEVKGTVFVLGMDKEVVERGIEARYHDWFHPSELGETSEEEKERQELPIRGDAYLQKMVQIPFHLPPLGLNDIEGYMDKLEQDLEGEEKLSIETRSVLARGLYPNPRQVKRALNTIRLLKGLVLAREERYRSGDEEGGLKPETIAWPLLAKTMLIQQQWPELYRNWRHYPVLVPMLEQEYEKRPLSPTEAVLGEMNPTEGRIQGTVDDELKREKEITSMAPIQPGNLLYPYFKNRRKYQRLEQFIKFPSAQDHWETRKRARFSGLEPAEIEPYLLLVSSAVESQVEDRESVIEFLPDDLLSGDPVKVQSFLAQFKRTDSATQATQLPQLQHSLMAVLNDSERSTQERVSAGNSLAELNDPRFDRNIHYLPDDPLAGFRLVPAGDFWLGSSPEADPDAEGDEQPQEKISLSTFYIARFPVTVAQFRAFVENQKVKLIDENSLKGTANHPVVNVTWHEALKYCEWLTVELKNMAIGKLETGYQMQVAREKHTRESEWRQFWGGLSRGEMNVTLPSEAEWEKAGRGTDGWIYPWGNEFNANMANTSEAGIGTTTPVGCFPGGASPYGALDMSGNVWEWTRSHFEPYPYKTHDGRENLKTGVEVRRVLRGGSFSPFS